MASSSAVSVDRRRSCFSTLAFVVSGGDVVVERRPQQRCRQLPRKLVVDNLLHSPLKDHHNSKCYTNLFGRKRLSVYARLNTDKPQWMTAKSKLESDEFSQ